MKPVSRQASTEIAWGLDSNPRAFHQFVAEQYDGPSPPISPFLRLLPASVWCPFFLPPSALPGALPIMSRVSACAELCHRHHQHLSVCQSGRLLPFVIRESASAAIHYAAIAIHYRVYAAVHITECRTQCSGSTKPVTVICDCHLRLPPTIAEGGDCYRLRLQCCHWQRVRFVRVRRKSSDFRLRLLNCDC